MIIIKDKEMTKVDIFNLEMGKNDAGAKTIGEYIKILMLKVILDGESFSGKRPFGNSGWEYELYLPLIKEGIVDGKLYQEEDCEYIEECDDVQAINVIKNAINDHFQNESGQHLPVWNTNMDESKDKGMFLGWFKRNDETMGIPVVCEWSPEVSSSYPWRGYENSYADGTITAWMHIPSKEV